MSDKFNDVKKNENESESENLKITPEEINKSYPNAFKRNFIVYTILSGGLWGGLLAAQQLPGLQMYLSGIAALFSANAIKQFNLYRQYDSYKKTHPEEVYDEYKFLQSKSDGTRGYGGRL